MRIYYDSVEKRNEAHVLLDKGEMTELSIAMPCSISLAVGRIIIDYLKQVCVEMDSAKQRADIIVDDIKEVLDVLFSRLDNFEDETEKQSAIAYKMLQQELEGFSPDKNEDMPIAWTPLPDGDK